MTFRARLTLFFLGIVSLPLVAGAFVADHLSRAQAVRDADTRLQVASLAAAATLQRERAEVTRAVSPTFAVRAFQATAAELDRFRRAKGLDYLLVVRRGRPVTASIGLPASIRQGAISIAGGSLRSLAAQSRIVVRTVPGSSVIGGRLWEPAFPAGLGVRAVLVVGGRPVGATPGPFTPSSSPIASGADRLVCLCSRQAPPSGLALFTPARPGTFTIWLQWPRVGVILAVIAALAALAYLLAWLLSRPLRRLADEVAAVARGEAERLETRLDPTVGAEIFEVAQTLRAVSAELNGSRGELERTKGKLARAERMTLTDPLTGAWNRRYLRRALREQVKRHARFGRPFAVLMIDIDRFKRVNDEHGHAVGDAVLIAVARSIDGVIRSDIDVLARFGGEEFVAVLPESDGDGGQVAAEKIRERVAGSAFGATGAEVSVTVSVGVAACPRDGIDADQLLAAADAALYRAKETGRNRVASA